MSAGRPVFCAEVFTAPTTATFDITFPTETDFSLSWDVPAGLYWLGGLSSPASPSLGDAFADALKAADPNSDGFFTLNYIYTVTSIDSNLGAVCRLRRSKLAGEDCTITATNAAAEHVLWSLGFRAATDVVLDQSDTLEKFAETTGIPYGTWWPKAPNVITDRFTPVEVAAYTSPLAGSGTAVASVRMEPTTQSRYWRTWRILPIDAARCNYRRAVSAVNPSWATSAGITSNPGDAALDNPDWWWSRVLDGSRRFVAIEDEAELVSVTPRYGVYRIVYDDAAPVNMDAFKGMRPPVLRQWSPAGSRQELEFCSILVDDGNL